jgi:uncharacterized protein
VNADPVSIVVDAEHSVSGLMQRPAHVTACYVLAHGAGAGMNHEFMRSVADGLAERRIATLRFQFPSMERGSKRPDRPALAHATVRAAVAMAESLAFGSPLFAGGKSFGARMTSQAQAEAAMTPVRGLVFLGFPLHPAGKPSDERAQHLAKVRVPTLFLQGTRDPLADMRLLAPLADRLGPNATVQLFEAADHSFHVPVRSGRTDMQVLGTVLDAAAAWMEAIVARDR